MRGVEGPSKIPGVGGGREGGRLVLVCGCQGHCSLAPRERAGGTEECYRAVAC